MLSAPPGAGKTVALRSWLDGGRFDGHVIELRLPEGEGGLWAALAESTSAKLGGAAIDHALPDEAVAQTLTPLVSSVDEPVLFVFDDLDRLEAGSELLALSHFIAEAPPHVHFLIACRRDVALGLHRTRLYGELSEVRAKELAFTCDEAVALFELSGVEIDVEHVEQFVALTEGWAAGLRFAALSMSNCVDPEAFLARFDSTEHVVSEFLLHEVLDRQDSELRDFLLLTAQCQRISAPLADAITGRTDSARVLADLERNNVFLEADETGTWYRYHALFAALLRAEAHVRLGPRVDAVHAPAARWLAQHGLATEALAHGIAAGDAQLAEELVASLWTELIGRDVRSVAMQLLDSIPAEATRDLPHLALLAAWARLAAGDVAEVDEWLALADGSAPADGPGRPPFDFGRALVLLARARLVGDLAAVDAATAQLESGPALIRSRSDSERRRLLVLCASGSAAAWRGELDTAATLLERALVEARRLGLPGSEIDASSTLALVYGLRGELKRAERLGRWALACADRLGRRPATVVPAMLALTLCSFEWDDGDAGDRALALAAATAAETGDVLGAIAACALSGGAIGRYGTDAADDLRIELTGLCDRLAGPPPALLDAPLRILRSRLALGENDFEEARAALTGAKETPEIVIALARVELAAGEAERAEIMLTPVVEETTAHVRLHTAVEARVLRSLVAERIGRYDEAREWLEAALELAEPEGIRGPFIDAGSAILEPLRRTIRRGTAHRWLAAALLASFEGRVWEHGAPRELLTPLSDKEKVVLRYLPTLLSNHEIASEMFISVNTVKTHLKNIYRKLAVSHRRDAVQRARELRLIG
jgi:LuxR family maltose regulon positive regulatory protein